GIVLGEYWAHLFPLLDGALCIKITGVSVIVIFALLQWKSVTMGSKVQNFTTILKGLVFFVMVVACFTMGRSAQVKFPSAPAVAIPAGAALVTAMLLGMQATIFTYDGWDGAIYFGDEMKNPGHLIPRAIF